ncbi:hypothetical protein LJB42_000766 [Komagataella kurtzmanii]|nr:hypothetical protein LJB42_000766 [Komagataella kurtzmanii]
MRLNDTDLDIRTQKIPVLTYNDSLDNSIEDLTIESTTTSKTSRSTRKRYRNKTFIDWIYEYELAKHVRETVTKNGSPLLQMYIPKSKWVVLGISSVTMGVLVVLIDFLSLWLHDKKYGYCSGHLVTIRSNCEEGQWKGWSQTIFTFMNSETVFHSIGNLVICLVLSGIFATMAVLITTKYSFSAHSGIAELKIILNGLIINGFLNIKVVLSKILGIIMVVAAGIWAGKDGPLVHISAGICNFFLTKIPNLHSQNQALKRELIAATTAAGIALAFNSPIGGILFVFEQFSGSIGIHSLMWPGFVSSTIAVTVMKALHPFDDIITGNLFVVTEDKNWLNVELIPFIFLGCLGGFLGVLFNQLNIRLQRFRVVKFMGSKQAQLLDVLAVCLITVLLSYGNSFSGLTLTEMTSALFTDCSKSRSGVLCGASTLQSDNLEFPWKLCLVLLSTFCQGIILTAYAVGGNIPGGVLLPSLTIGALLGRLFGTILKYYQLRYPSLDIFMNCNSEGQCISPGSYAVIGAASFLTGVTRMTITVIAIMMEVTGALTYVLPVMIGVLFSILTNSILSGKSSYELWLKLNDYPYLRPGIEEFVNPDLTRIPCHRVFKPTNQLFVICKDKFVTVNDICDILESANVSGFPVLEKEGGKFIGYISSYELQLELDNLLDIEGVDRSTAVTLNPSSSDYSLEGILETNLLLLPPEMDLLTCYDFFQKMSTSIAIFCDSRNQLVGIFSRVDIIELVEKSGVELERL